MVSLFPIEILNEEQNLNGIFARIRLIRPDWNTSKIIETKPNHLVDYSDYQYDAVISEDSGDVTFAINGDTNNGLSLYDDSPSENYTITIIFHSLKIKLKKYVIQKFLNTSCSPEEWVLEGFTDKGAWEFIDYQKNTIPNESTQINTFFPFHIPNNDKYYSSYRFNINQQTIINGKTYLKIKNIEFYGEIDYSKIQTKNIPIFPFHFFKLLIFILLIS